MAANNIYGPVGLWVGFGDAHPTKAAQEAANEIEELGFTTMWIPEALGRDVFVSSTNYLAATKTLKIATGIANIYARDPMTTNASSRTLAEAYPDRFLLGLGVSHGHLVAGIRKHDYSKPLAHMSEYLDRMDSAMFMAVGPKETPPRVLAALGPKMLELSATKALGTHPYFTTPDHTLIAREAVGPDALVMPELMVVLETDPVKAREIARAKMKIYLGLPNYTNNLARIGFAPEDWADGGSDRLVDAITCWGSIDRIVARVAEHHAAGADHVCIQVLRADNEFPRAEWKQLADALL